MYRYLRLVAIAAVTLVALTLFTGSASAQTGPNALLGLYQVSPWRDNFPNMPLGVPRQVCFLANGTWYVPGGFFNLPWTGQQFQKGVNIAAGNGNTITGIGNFLGGLGNGSFKVEMLTIGIAAGTWNQWIDLPPFGTFNVFPFQVALTFVSPVCPAPILASVDATRLDPDQLPAKPEDQIPFLSTATGEPDVEQPSALVPE